MVVVKTVGVPRTLQQPIPRGVPTLFEVLITGVPTGNAGADLTAADLGVAKILRGLGCQQFPAAGALASDASVACTLSADQQTLTVTHSAGGDRNVNLLVFAIP